MTGHRAGPGRPADRALRRAATVLVLAMVALGGCGGKVDWSRAGATTASARTTATDVGTGADTDWMDGPGAAEDGLDRPAFCDVVDDLKQVSRMVDRTDLAKAKRSVALLYAVVSKAADQAPGEIADEMADIRSAYGEFNEAVQAATTRGDLTDAGDALEDHPELNKAGEAVDAYLEEHCSGADDS